MHVLYKNIEFLWRNLELLGNLIQVLQEGEIFFLQPGWEMEHVWKIRILDWGTIFQKSFWCVREENINNIYNPELKMP